MLFIYLIFIPLGRNDIVLTPTFVALVAYGGYLKTRSMFHRPFVRQMKIHAQCFIVWAHTMALIRRWKLDGYFTRTLFDTVTLQTSQCRGNLYGVLWFYGLIACVTLHGIHLYWTFTWRVQTVPNVKKYQMLPPPKMKKK